MAKIIRIIRPSSQEIKNLLPDRISKLKKMGFTVLYDPLPSNSSWTYTAATIKDRAQALETALLENESDIVLSARGGYGASDLLPHLNWEKLSKAKPKLIIGFSDISAIHSALYSKCGWRGVHGPMPATNLWQKNGSNDVDELLLQIQEGSFTGSISVNNVVGSDREIKGKLFGGCFSVLTNLIGTPYFPKTLKNHILFFEDIGESPARLIRYWNQWIQSGVLNGVQGIVLGQIVDLGENIENSAEFFIKEFASRVDLPVWQSLDFGHISPNMPIVIGANSKISKNHLEFS